MYTTAYIQEQAINFKVIKSITFYDSSGEKITINDCECTSSSFKHKTINVRLIGSGNVRTIRTITIIELNGTEVCR